MALLRKLSPKTLIVIVAIAALLFYLYSSNNKIVATVKKEMYMKQGSGKAQAQAISGANLDDDYGDYAPANLAGTSINTDIGCSMKAGTGLASSLMPREVASQEDYAQFAPNDILKGQNFLDPREQVGWPETIGGTIRNGNHDLRADPPNPKDQYVWNNSTIVPDLMQRNLFCN
jgi:hypothetical protein